MLFSGKAIPVSYAGYAPGAILGVSQVNFQIPPMFILNTQDSASFMLQVIAQDGSRSSSVTLWVSH
jgi:uncharacterized protein (TIGR03437 family)